MNKLYDLLKYIIYASFYVIVIKTSMDFYEYKRFPKLYEPNSAPWYTEALLYCAASFAAQNFKPITPIIQKAIEAILMGSSVSPRLTAPTIVVPTIPSPVKTPYETPMPNTATGFSSKNRFAANITMVMTV